MLPVDPPAVVAAVVAFAHGLRSAGVPVSTSETLDAVRAVAAVDASRRTQVRAALRGTLVKENGPAAIFDRLFELIFPVPRRGPADGPGPGDAERATPGPATPDPGSGGVTDPAGQLTEALRAGDRDSLGAALDSAVHRWGGLDGPVAGERHHVQRVLRHLDLSRVLRELIRGDRDRTPLQRQLDIAEANAEVARVRQLLEEIVRSRLAGPGAGPAQAPPTPDQLADEPLLYATGDQLVALRAAVRPLARRIATRLGRRRRRTRGQLDMRRTLRESLSVGGVPLNPRLRRRHPVKPDLVVLCDVSGSIAQFAPFTLALLHALHEEFQRVRSWVFIDGIVEITDHLAAAPGIIDVHHLLARRGLVSGDGRSDYRAALEHFRRVWPDAVTGRTTVLVIGDARHHDRPPALAELAELHRLSRRLYWFNPEPGREWDTDDSVMSGYAPYATRVFEVGTLRQLGEAVTAIG